MSTVTITTDGGKTTVRSPYHPDWPAEARRLGGKWSGGAWVFDSRDEDRVRALARDTFGTDGSPDPGGTVTVRVAVTDAMGEKGGKPAALYLYGRLVATRYARDNEPTLGPGIVLVSGGFGDGGSHNYLKLGPLDDTFVEIRDVPRVVALDHGLKIVGEDAGPDREALRAERERLVARLAEVDALLAE
jgi:hypothetical protein